MGLRERVRSWILDDEERATLAWAGRKREPLRVAVWQAEWTLRQSELARQRELVQAFEGTDLDRWEASDPRIHIYFGPRPAEGFFQYELDRQRRRLKDLETDFQRWQEVSPR